MYMVVRSRRKAEKRDPVKDLHTELMRWTDALGLFVFFCCVICVCLIVYVFVFSLVVMCWLIRLLFFAGVLFVIILLYCTGENAFMGGNVVNTADLCVYGAVKSLLCTDAHKTFFTNKKFEKWFKSVRDVVGKSSCVEYV